jgi:hypothetical protein
MQRRRLAAPVSPGNPIKGGRVYGGLKNPGCHFGPFSIEGSGWNRGAKNFLIFFKKKLENWNSGYYIGNVSTQHKRVLIIFSNVPSPG